MTALGSNAHIFARPHRRQDLRWCFETALGCGLKYAYTGNVVDPSRQGTYCPGCGELVIGRDWHAVTAYRLVGDRCGSCGHRIAGRFDEAPGRWGRRRMPVVLDPGGRDR